MEKIKDALLEAGKEAGRVIVMALVSWGLSRLASLPQSETVMIGTLLLRIVDKYIHTLGSLTKNESMLKGLVRF